EHELAPAHAGPAEAVEDAIHRSPSSAANGPECRIWGSTVVFGQNEKAGMRANTTSKRRFGAAALAVTLVLAAPTRTTRAHRPRTAAKPRPNSGTSPSVDTRGPGPVAPPKGGIREESPRHHPDCHHLSRRARDRAGHDGDRCERSQQVQRQPDRLQRDTGRA